MITKIKTKKKVERKPKRKVYSNRIMAMLKDINMSQQELADLIKTDNSHLSKIINGKRRCISLPIALEIAKALNKHVEEVFQLSSPAKTIKASK